MPTRFTVPLLTAALVLLTGCDQPSPQATDPGIADAEILALVNEVPITRADVFGYAGLDSRAGIGPAENILEELVNLELLRQEALARGIDQEEETRSILRSIETNLLASQVIERKTEDMRFSEDQIRAEYEAQIGDYGPTEYRARHILVNDEAEAVELIAALDDGADFAELAAEHSIDTSGPDGGDLGWFAPGQMIPAFTEAVQALAPGEYTPAPVATQFGWHVIRLEDTRDITPPPLDDVRSQIREILQTRELRAYMDELRAGAEIEFPVRPAQ